MVWVRPAGCTGLYRIAYGRGCAHSRVRSYYTSVVRGSERLQRRVRCVRGSYGIPASDKRHRRRRFIVKANVEIIPHKAAVHTLITYLFAGGVTKDPIGASVEPRPRHGWPPPARRSADRPSDGYNALHANMLRMRGHGSCRNAAASRRGLMFIAPGRPSRSAFRHRAARRRGCAGPRCSPTNRPLDVVIQDTSDISRYLHAAAPRVPGEDT